jgi:trigger factor
LKIEVKQITSCKRDVSVEVPPESLKEEYELLCERYRQKAKVAGFRPGKAPLSVVMRHYRAAIREDFLDRAVQKHLLEVLKAENLSPLEPPQVRDLNYEDGGMLVFRALFEVLPKLALSDYRGLEIEKIIPEVKEEEIENALQQMQENSAEFVPVEGRSIQIGDYAVISYSGKFLDRSHADIESKETTCEVGGKNTLKEFSDILLDVRSGETRAFSVAYPQDYPNKQMAGREVQYSIQVQAIKVKKLPELNDDFAKNLGKYDSLEGLRARISKDLRTSKENAAKSEMQEQFLEKILERNPFEVPEGMVERQTEVRLNEYIRSLIMQGIHPQTLDVNWTELRQRQKQRAEHDVRASLLLDHIADEAKVEVSDEEVEEEIVKRAREAKQGVEAFKSRLTKEGGTDRIKNRIRNRKTLDVLLTVASFKNPQGMVIQP